MTASLSSWLLAAAIGVAGLVAGLAYFALLRRTVALFSVPGGRRRALLLTAVRMAAAVLLLWLAARQGAFPLLAALGGFLAARVIALRLFQSIP
jgi:hypothetical protein